MTCLSSPVLTCFRAPRHATVPMASGATRARTRLASCTRTRACSATTEPLTLPEEEDVGAAPLPSRAACLSRLAGHHELAQCDTYRKLVAELWGTFVLVFVGIGALLLHSYSPVLSCTQCTCTGTVLYCTANARLVYTVCRNNRRYGGARLGARQVNADRFDLRVRVPEIELDFSLLFFQNFPHLCERFGVAVAVWGVAPVSGGSAALLHYSALFSFVGLPSCTVLYCRVFQTVALGPKLPQPQIY